MSGSEIVFYLFAVIAVFSALATVTRKNPVVAAVWLVASFFAVAVCYILLSATFLAAIQVIVYAGAMMVLFVFVIMVLDVSETGEATHKKPARIGQIGYYVGVALASGFVLWVLAGTLARQFTTPGADISEMPGFGTANEVGRVLFTDYLFAFEGVSMLLMASVVGAVVVARSHRERLKEAKAAGMSEAQRRAAGLVEPTAPDQDGDGDPDPVPGAGPTPGQNYGAPSAGGHEGGM